MVSASNRIHVAEAVTVPQRIVCPEATTAFETEKGHAAQHRGVRRPAAARVDLITKKCQARHTADADLRA